MTEKNDPASPPLAPVVAAAIIAIFLWIINFIYGLHLDKDERGLFGDMFGAVNSVFSGLAFIGVVYAIFLQRYEVSITKLEIEYTKNILSEQKEQLKRQNQEAKKESFESTYFQMLRLFIEMTNQIDLRQIRAGQQIITKGKDAFPFFVRQFKEIYNPSAKALYGGHDFDNSYKEFFRRYNTELGHYFRLLYNIVNYVDTSDVDNRHFYVKILRAQLSNAEVAILYYNGISPYGAIKFKPLIERYGLLKNLNDADILDEELKSRYQISAFGNPHKLHE